MDTGDLFRTQADTRFNSFSDPLNPVNMNQAQGSWGVNSAYLTPPYAAPYRPQYQGAYGTQAGSPSVPGFWKSAYHTLSPIDFSQSNYGGNTYNQTAPFYTSLARTPVDSMMSISQKLIVPTAAAYAAYKYGTGFSEQVGSRVFSGIGRGALSGMGLEASTVAKGANFLGKAGGLAGNLFGGALIAQAAVSAADSLIFDPYVVQSQMSSNIRRNFGNASFGGSFGNAVTGRGLSRGFSSGIATQLGQFGAKDVTFNQKEVADMSDLSSRAGLLDNVMPDQFASKFKSLAREVKLVMQVANTSDFREAVEVIAKMQQGGAIGGAATRTIAGIGGFASQAGVSAQKLMNTVGVQGQYMFGSNGLTPYLGQLAAGQAYSSFATAYRSGLMSPALMARMGGVEGATQSALAGTLSAVQTPFSNILGINAMQSGNLSGGVTGNVNRFGASAARDSVQMLGTMGLHKGALQSRLAEQPLFIQKQLSTLAGPMNLLSNGKLSAEKAYALLTETGMMDENSARATIEKWRSDADPRSMNLRLSGIETQKRDTIMKAMEQMGSNHTFLNDEINKVGSWGRSIKAGSSSGMGKIVTAAGDVSDAIEGWINKKQYGSALQGSREISLGASSKAQKSFIDFGDTTDFSLKESRTLSKISELAKSGDEHALAFMEATRKRDKVGAANALGEIAGKVGVGTSSSEIQNIVGSAMEAGATGRTLAVGGDSKLGGDFEELSTRFNKMYGGKGNLLAKVELNELLAKGTGGGLDFWKDEKNSDLKKKIFDITGKEVSNDVLSEWSSRAANQNLSQGTSQLTDLLSKEGTDAKTLTKELADGTFSNRLSGDKKADFESKAKGKSAAERQKLALGYLANKHGKGLDSQMRLNETSETGDYDKTFVALRELEKQSDEAKQLYKEGRIDFTTYNQINSSLTSAASATKFDNAVNNFAKAVEAMGGKEVNVKETSATTIGSATGNSYFAFGRKQ